MSRKLDLLGWYFQALSTGAVAITTSVLELPLGQRAMLYAAAWIVSAYLTAWPYTRRFGGGMADWLWIGTALGLVAVLPLVPYFWGEASEAGSGFLVVFLGCFVLAGVGVASLRAQGRHFYAERELPELAGEPRQAVEAVLARAGLEPVSVRVATLPTFNAMVQGLGRPRLRPPLAGRPLGERPVAPCQGRGRAGLRGHARGPRRAAEARNAGLDPQFRAGCPPLGNCESILSHHADMAPR